MTRKFCVCAVMVISMMFACVTPELGPKRCIKDEQCENGHCVLYNGFYITPNYVFSEPKYCVSKVHCSPSTAAVGSHCRNYSGIAGSFYINKIDQKGIGPIYLTGCEKNPTATLDNMDYVCTPVKCKETRECQEHKIAQSIDLEYECIEGFCTQVKK